MIIYLLAQLVFNLLDFIFVIEIPSIPEEIMVNLSNFLDILCSGMGFVWLILPKQLVLLVIPIVVTLANFDQIYGLVIWIMKKIPFLGMK